MTWTAADHARKASEVLAHGEGPDHTVFASSDVRHLAQAHALTAIALALTDKDEPQLDRVVGELAAASSWAEHERASRERREAQWSYGKPPEGP